MSIAAAMALSRRLASLAGNVPSVGDTAIVPLYHQVSLWGTKNGISYVPRTDESTLAHKFKPR